MNTKLFEVDVPNIKKLFEEEGLSVKEVAEKYGTASSTIRNFCIKYEISYKKEKETPSKARLLEVYNDLQLTSKEKAKALGLSTSEMYKALAFHNISILSDRDPTYYVDRHDDEYLCEILTDMNMSTNTKCSKLNVTLDRLCLIYKEHDLNYFKYNQPDPEDYKKPSKPVKIKEEIIEEVEEEFEDEEIIASSSDKISIRQPDKDIPNKDPKSVTINFNFGTMQYEDISKIIIQVLDKIL